ncbi:hypothetical protein AWB85_21775 [Mycobacteroides immunogenum]|uniref:Uncharacterized protein n=1 Tax=Mycobacteroides immunogenum TaxID=83262 RepID=A0A179VCD2_9MYCO|nr:hypothetical protein [Mycobacteroides immunogenum]OAT69394.1 hypothetical protein AWB85_21775 [Mycobacteroides immunogenum]
MNTLTALLHPGELLHPQRRYRLACEHIALAVEHDRRWNPALTASLQDGARNVTQAVDELRRAAQDECATRAAHAVVEIAVAAIRLAAELPDPLRLSLDQSYAVVRQNAWADLQGDLEEHRRSWASLHEGLGVIDEHEFTLADAATGGDLNRVHLAAIWVAAMCIRYLGELTPEESHRAA